MREVIVQLGLTDPDTVYAGVEDAVRFFVCEEDLSHDGPDALLPDRVAPGADPLIVIGAMAGG